MRLPTVVPALLLVVVALLGCAAPRPAPETPPAPRLYRVIVPVPDLERAVAFYSALLELPGERVSPGRHYFDCGGTILALLEPARDGDAHAPRPLPDHLYFAVDDLEAACERADALGALVDATGDGGLPMGAIAVRPWGERSVYLRDPFGTPLCLVDARTLFTGG